MQSQIEQACSFFIRKDTLMKLIEDQKNIDADLLHFSIIFWSTGEVNVVVTSVNNNNDLSKGFLAFFKSGVA